LYREFDFYDSLLLNSLFSFCDEQLKRFEFQYQRSSKKEFFLEGKKGSLKFESFWRLKRA